MGIDKCEQKELDKGKDVAVQLDLERKHDITLEELKSCTLFKECTDAEAIEIINTLKRFTVIMFEYFKEVGNRDMQ